MGRYDWAFDSWLNKAVDTQRAIINNEILNVILIMHPPFILFN
jgi:hypothetical protein